MKRIAPLAAALAAAALLAACGPSVGWSKKGLHPSAWSIDENNCAWEATHELQGDGTYASVDRSDEEIQTRTQRCMQDLGYTWGPVDD